MSPMRHHYLIPILLVAVPSSAAEWQMQPGSEFTFEATFEGVPTPGRFAGFELDLYFDPDNPDDARLRVTVDLAAADMGDPEMNAVLADPAWFDSATSPEAVFDSKDIDERPDGEFVANGILELKSTRQAVAVPFAWCESADGARMRGELVLERTDFDVGSGEWATDDSIGVDVLLRFDIRLEQRD